jgi:adenylate cyclase
MSRLHQIPHPSSCGGRGRCSTCRVLVEAGHERLPEPAGIEKRMLDRIRAPQQVRLACQLRPTRNLVVRILLPSLARQLGNADGDISGDLGHQQALTVLFADMRGFSSLARHQPAGDLMVLLNRIIDDMSQACEARGGRVLIVETDGVMAVFGLEKPLREGARAAVQAAGDILRALDTANRDLGAALPQPVRVGIGVHSGEVVVTRLGDPGRGYKLVAIGDPVVIAHRLEEATKEFAADCIVSEETLRLAGLAAGQTRVAQVFYKNGEAPVVAGIFGSREDLERALRRRLADQDPQPA